MSRADESSILSFEGKKQSMGHHTSVSYLSPDSIRWMNKRRPKGGSASAVHVLPSRALQLSQIFKGLDFDNSGAIDIEELKEAIAFVARNDTSKEKVFENPKKLTDFFMAMDTDGNGIVDGNEFMIAMNSEASTNDGTAKLQQAFFDFANQHRRQMLIDNIKGNNIGATELEKYEAMKKLFGIAYFKDESYALSLEDKIARAKADAKKDAADMNNAIHRASRENELIRARESALYFKSIQHASEKKFNVVLASLQSSNIPSAERVTEKIEWTIRNNAARLPLQLTETYVPILNASTSTVIKSPKKMKNKTIVDGTNTKLRVIHEIRGMKAARNRVDVANLNASRPLSIKDYHTKISTYDPDD